MYSDLIALFAVLTTRFPFVTFTLPVFSTDMRSVSVVLPIAVVLNAMRVPWAVSVQVSAAVMFIDARFPDE